MEVTAMQHALPEELERDIARAYEAGDLASAIESLTAAFRKRQGESVSRLEPIETMKDDVSLDELTREQGSKVVKDWRDLLGPGGPEGETAEDFLRPIYEMRDADQDRDLF